MREQHFNMILWTRSVLQSWFWSWFWPPWAPWGEPWGQLALSRWQNARFAKFKRARWHQGDPPRTTTTPPRTTATPPRTTVTGPALPQPPELSATSEYARFLSSDGRSLSWTNHITSIASAAYAATSVPHRLHIATNLQQFVPKWSIVSHICKCHNCNILYHICQKVYHILNYICCILYRSRKSFSITQSFL